MSTFLARYGIELGVAGLIALTHLVLIVMLVRERRVRLRSVRAARESETARQRAERDAMSRLQMLAHASRTNTLGALSGSLAHELNQPLTAILTNAQVAGKLLSFEPPRRDDIREILDDIVSDTKRASEVIRRLRKLLRADDADHKPVDVNDIVSTTIRLVADDIIVRKVRLSVELESGLPPIIGDGVQLQQVVLNLLVNAIDALEQVAPERRLVSVTTARKDRTLAIRVVDAGPGAPPDVLARMFEPFVTTKSSGLGLGLYINRSIIATHGGDIRASAAPQGGLAMEITLPCALDVAEPVAVVEPTAPEATEVDEAEAGRGEGSQPEPRSNTPFHQPLSP